MLEVDIDKILPVTEARDNFNKIIDEVEGTEAMYVLTKNGKPSAVIVGVNHLEKLTGKTADELTSIVEKKADETPVVEEVAPQVPNESTGITSLGDNVAGGSKPPETDAVAAGRSIQEGAAADNLSTPAESPGAAIDVPVETEVRTPAESAEGPLPQVAPVPTSSPGSAAMSDVASNQAPAAAPTENGAAASDSDLFV